LPNLFAQFAYLQLLDLLTTLTFLMHGVEEANPAVRLLVRVAGSALAGLLAAKLVALGLALYCWRGQRERLLKRVNLFYAGLVAWNLAALFLIALREART
jgi:hypothetical protein